MVSKMIYKLESIKSLQASQKSLQVSNDVYQFVEKAIHEYLKSIVIELNRNIKWRYSKPKLPVIVTSDYSKIPEFSRKEDEGGKRDATTTAEARPIILRLNLLKTHLEKPPSGVSLESVKREFTQLRQKLALIFGTQKKPEIIWKDIFFDESLLPQNVLHKGQVPKKRKIIEKIDPISKRKIG